MRSLAVARLCSRRSLKWKIHPCRLSVALLWEQAMPSTSCLSRLLGHGDREAANRAASTALYSGLIVGAVMITLTAVFLRPILTLLGATETIIPYALAYARIYVISCIFNVFNVTMNNIAASEGAAKTTMCALLLGAVLNIGLDPVFIYALDLGVTGAAAATAMSQFISTLVYLTYIIRKKAPLHSASRILSLPDKFMRKS